MQPFTLSTKEKNMQTQLKENEFYNRNEVGVHLDAHIKAYQAQNLGIKIIFCDSRGVPITDSMAPLSSYLPKTSFNM